MAISAKLTSAFAEVIDFTPAAERQNIAGHPYGLYLDGPPHPFKDNNGTPIVIASHSESYRFHTAGNLNYGGPWTKVLAYNSPRQTGETQMNNRAWLFGHYAIGHTVYSIAHMEQYYAYKPATAVGGIPGFWDQSDLAHDKKWKTGIQLLKSTNDGQNFAPINGPGAASMVLIPEPFATQNKNMAYGFLHPSNIVKEGNYYYAMVEIRELEQANQYVNTGFGMIRTNNLDSGQWQFYNKWGTWAAVNKSTFQGNTSWQEPKIFFVENNWNFFAPGGYDRNNRMAQVLRFHTPTSQWLLFGCTGMVAGQLCFTRSATLANPQFEANGRTMVDLNKFSHDNRGDEFGGANFFSVFDEAAADQNFQNIGNNLTIYVVKDQAKIMRQSLQITP